MEELSLEQQQALARARARARAAAAASAAPAAPAAPEPGPLGNGALQTIDDSVSGVGSGIPFSDEIEATAAMPFRAIARKVQSGDWSAPGLSDFGDAYNTEVTGIRDRRKAAGERSPVATTVGQIAGGLTTMGRGGAAPASTWGGRALQAGKEGAVYGGVYGAGEGEGSSFVEGIKDRAKKAAGGALVGGLTGLGVSPVGEAVVKGVQTKVAPALRSVFKHEDEASRRVGIAISKDRELTRGNEVPDRGLYDNEFNDAVSEQVPVMNLDRGAQYTRGLADSVATESPGARNILAKKLNDRYTTQFDRADSLLDEMTPGGTEEIRDGLLARARSVNDPAYRAAHTHANSQMMWDDQLARFAQADVVRGAMKKAVSTGTNDAVRKGAAPIRHPFSIDKTTGELTLANPNVAPNLAFWDKVKRKMDDEIGSLKRNGAKDAVAEAVDIKNQLVAHIDSLVPDYKSARRGAAGFIGAENALDAGAMLVNKKVPTDVAFRMFTKMNDAERELARIGITNALKERLGEVRKRADLSKNLFNNPNAEKRLGIFLGDKNMGRLGNLLKNETLMNVSKDQVLGGSQTKKRFADAALSGLTGGALYSAGTGDTDPYHLLTAGGLAGFGGKKIAHHYSERMAVEIARKLTSGNSKAYREASQLLTRNPHLLATVRALTAPLGIAAGQVGAARF